MLLRLRRLSALLVVVSCASAGQAWTAPDPVSPGEISGFDVRDVRYGFAAEHPDLIAKVSFALAPAPAAPVRVHVRVSASAGWSACAYDGLRVECRLASPVPVREAHELSVSAA
ncbi:MAG: hypothetical protein ACRDN6_05365 [Gaiellaceae bacterium]